MNEPNGPLTIQLIFVCFFNANPKSFIRCGCQSVSTYTHMYASPVFSVLSACMYTEVKWTKLYQVPPVYGAKSKETKRQLMVRPRYPPLCHESDLPCVSAISEATVIIDDVWKIGDLVDWWKDDCYWSGKVTQILGNGMLQVIILFSSS